MEILNTNYTNFRMQQNLTAKPTKIMTFGNLMVIKSKALFLARHSF